MRLDVFNEATELYNKYKMCEELLATLSNERAARGQKYKDALAKFADTFKGEFMMFVHERMTACVEAFEECGKCDCDKQTEDKEPNFTIGEKVWYRYNEDETLLCKVVGFEKNSNRIIVEFKEDEDEDATVIFHVDPEELEKYDESEQPTPPADEDDKYEMVYGERVIVKSGEYAGKVGTIIDVMVGFTKILVGLDDVEDAVEFTPDQLAKYKPENPEV